MGIGYSSDFTSDGGYGSAPVSFLNEYTYDMCVSSCKIDSSIKSESICKSGYGGVSSSAILMNLIGGEPETARCLMDLSIAEKSCIDKCDHSFGVGKSSGSEGEKSSFPTGGGCEPSPSGILLIPITLNYSESSLESKTIDKSFTNEIITINKKNIENYNRKPFGDSLSKINEVGYIEVWKLNRIWESMGVICVSPKHLLPFKQEGNKYIYFSNKEFRYVLELMDDKIVFMVEHKGLQFPIKEINSSSTYKSLVKPCLTMGENGCLSLVFLNKNNFGYGKVIAKFGKEKTNYPFKICISDKGNLEQYDKTGKKVEDLYTLTTYLKSLIDNPRKIKPTLQECIDLRMELTKTYPFRCTNKFYHFNVTFHCCFPHKIDPVKVGQEERKNVGFIGTDYTIDEDMAKLGYNLLYAEKDGIAEGEVSPGVWKKIKLKEPKMGTAIEPFIGWKVEVVCNKTEMQLSANKIRSL